MTLSDLSLKYKYRSSQNDILEEFLIPCLKQARSYDRAVGFFSSRALQLALSGIVELIKKDDSKIRIITSPYLTKRDIADIQKGLKKMNDVLQSAIMKEIEKLEEIKDRTVLASLGWLISRKKLEIRIGDVNIRNHHLFHDKLGIFTDGDRNKVIFFGSLNETYLGYKGHYEAIRVLTSWDDPEGRIWEEETDFELLWNDLDPMVKTFDLSKAIEKRLIRYRPKTLNDLLESFDEYGSPLSCKAKEGSISFNPKRIKPWPPQRRALQQIKENDYNGILKMATGTGKTAVALLAVEQFFKDYGRYGKRVVMLVPSTLLGEQWLYFLRNNTSDDELVFWQCSDISASRKRDLKFAWKTEWQNDEMKNVFVIINIQNLHNFDRQEKKIDLLISDEVHEYGTRKRIDKIRNKFGSVEHILGLSATPERYYDEQGTENVLSYFGPIIFSYGIRAAQREKKGPSQSTVLSKYNYYPYITALESEEEEKVRRISQEIAKIVAINYRNEISEDEEALSEKVERLMRERASILKKSKSKMKSLEKILTENRTKLRQCIVYCEDEAQLREAVRVFDKLQIKSYVEYHSKMKKREDALDLFRNKARDFVLSMHCLDQGVDIPDCHSLILLSSSGNPREYIQRRGRVLRNYEGKPIVNIFDTFAFPEEYVDLYSGMIRTRLLRAQEFVDCSQTPEEASKFDTIRNAYEIGIRDLRNTIKQWRGD